MIGFLLLAGALTVLVLWMLLPGLRRSTPTADEQEQEALNIAIAREHLANLRLEHEAGELNQAEFDRARTELERALAEDVAHAQTPATPAATAPWLPGALATLIPLTAFAIYWTLGTPAALDAPAGTRAPDTNPPTQARRSEQPPSVEDMINKLEARLRSQPDDADGWFMLGRSRMAFKRHAEAAQAFDKALALRGDVPQIMLAYADALAMSQGGRISGKPFELIKRALRIAPDNITAMWLGGMGYAEAGEFQTALELWTRLEPKLAGEPESQARVSGLIAMARERQGASGAQVPAARINKPSGGTESATRSINVMVSIDPRVRAQVSDTDTVFIFARALNGPRMPLAVVRKPVSALPLEVTLDDSQAMAPGAVLSAYEEVEIGARVSLSGSAIAQAGDWQSGMQRVVGKAGEPVRLLIDEAYKP